MNTKESPLFCNLDGLTPKKRQEQRLIVLKQFGLLEDKIIPLFDEATQTVANVLEVPISILGIIGEKEEEYLLKSTLGLFQLGLTNKMLQDRKIPLEETLSIYVIDSQQHLMIENTLNDSFFYKTKLVQQYGIKSYLGTPLITTENQCIGTLEIMDFVPRQFSQKDIALLKITARWCLAEYEKNYLLSNSEKMPNYDVKLMSLSPKNEILTPSENTLNNNNNNLTYNYQLIDKVIHKLLGKLPNPLTSIMGMSSILKRKIYGNLNEKQEEYLEIIHNSGQEMNLLLEEIVNLTNFDNDKKIDVSSVDLELLAQQIITNLKSLATKKEQIINLSIQPGNRIWKLDKNKIKQTIYYLLITLIEGSQTGGKITIYISNNDNNLNLSFWVRHPWLGEGIAHENIDIYSQIISQISADISHNELTIMLESLTINNKAEKDDFLWLLFSCYLITLQKGTIFFKGSLESGYRFIINFPLSKSV